MDSTSGLIPHFRANLGSLATGNWRSLDVSVPGQIEHLLVTLRNQLSGHVERTIKALPRNEVEGCGHSRPAHCAEKASELTRHDGHGRGKFTAKEMDVKDSSITPPLLVMDSASK